MALGEYWLRTCAALLPASNSNPTNNEKSAVRVDR
jgi:hypothetical protein